MLRRLDCCSSTLLVLVCTVRVLHFMLAVYGTAQYLQPGLRTKRVDKAKAEPVSGVQAQGKQLCEGNG